MKRDARDPQTIIKFEKTIEQKNKDIRETNWELKGDPKNHWEIFYYGIHAKHVGKRVCGDENGNMVKL